MGEADNNQNVQEQDLNQLLKVRREKLAVLQDGGKNPFEITKYDASHHSTEIKENFDTLEGKRVTIALRGTPGSEARSGGHRTRFSGRSAAVNTGARRDRRKP